MNVPEIEPLLEVPFFNFSGFNCRCPNHRCWQRCERGCTMSMYDKYPTDEYWDKTPMRVYQEN